MENHPIPQDVTGFQFKLIGDMTIKQFAYLAGGVIIGWVLYEIPITWLIKFPLMTGSVLMGVALAFLPVEGRPFDVMIINFLKALITPSHYMYEKTGRPVVPVLPKVAPTQQTAPAPGQSRKQLEQFLHQLPTGPKNTWDEKEMRFLGSLPGVKAAPSAPVQSTIVRPAQPLTFHAPSAPVAPKPVVAPLAPNPVQTPAVAAQQPVPQIPQPPEQQPQPVQDTLAKEAALIQQELAQAKQAEAQSTTPQQSASAHQQAQQLEKELQEIIAQKESLQNQLVALQKQLVVQKQNVFKPSVAKPQETTQSVRFISPAAAKGDGMPVTPSDPNLLVGIVKDAKGMTLPNILVEVKDTDDNPVRAFKTNGLGQFASATQLANGVYTVWFEDTQQKHKFDPVEIQVTGAIIPPLEVTAHDEREDLRRQLFQTT